MGRKTCAICGKKRESKFMVNSVGNSWFCNSSKNTSNCSNHEDIYTLRQIKIKLQTLSKLNYKHLANK